MLNTKLMQIFESQFPNDYRQAEIKKILDYVLVGKFCQVVCIPGAGKATVLRLLAHNRNILKFHLQEKEKSLRFIYLNFFELIDFSEAQIAKFMLLALDQKPQSQNDHLTLTKQLNETVNKLAGQGQTIVFLFDHFDEHQNRLPRSFFQTLKSLRSLAKYKFSVVFATRRDLADLVDEDILKDYWDFFVGNAIYLNVYDKVAVGHLFLQIEKVFAKKLTPDQKTRIAKIAGGHAKLTKIITELILSQKAPLETDSLLNIQQVQAALYEIWLFLTGVEQRELHSLSQNKQTPNTPESNTVKDNLVKFDLLKPTGQSGNIAIQQFNNLVFTIPIFQEFVKNTSPNTHEEITYNPQNREIKKGASIISELLSPQEYRLLEFLINNQGTVIGRDEIITAVWPQIQVAEAISDEAIDQMVFRLRKKIEDEPAEPKYILTVKGRGLKFEP